MSNFSFAGIFTDALSGAIATLVGLTGLCGGAARYGAVLASRADREVERATAFGFFLGFALGLVVLLVDSAT
jgi:hypothetical protein